MVLQYSCRRELIVPGIMNAHYNRWTGWKTKGGCSSNEVRSNITLHINLLLSFHPTGANSKTIITTVHAIKYTSMRIYAQTERTESVKWMAIHFRMRRRVRPIPATTNWSPSTEMITNSPLAILLVVRVATRQQCHCATIHSLLPSAGPSVSQSVYYRPANKSVRL